MQRPSESFRQWLDDWLKQGSPGQALPPVPELAGQWKISVSTVRRTLEAYQKKGKIVRIPGRGSIIPTSIHVPAETPVDQSVRQGWEYTAEAIMRAIFQGRFRKGRPLPSIKRLALEFHISRASAIRAYKHLEAAGHIEKIGKRFWTGGLPDRLATGTRRRIILYKQRHEALRNIYSDEAFHITRMLTTMENELARSGYIIEYEEIPSITTHLKRWASDRTYPHGVIIWVLHLAAPAIREPIEALLEQLNRHDIPTLVLSPLGPIPVPRCATLFSHGSTVTQQMRVAADYIVATGFTSGTLFLGDIRQLSGLQRFYPELLLRNPSFTFSIVVGKGCDVDGYFDRLKKAEKQALLYFLSKYRPIALDEYKSLFTAFGDLPEAFRRYRSSGIWLFSRDRDAADALDWAVSAGMRVPAETAILGFENNPEYYEYGISSCIRDSDQSGYLMAHVLMRDIPIAKTTSGFIKTSALIIHRKTTR